MAALSRLLTVNSGFACYLYSIDGVSLLPALLTCTYSIFIFSVKNNTKSIWKLIYIKSIIFALSLILLDKRKRLEGKQFILCPKKTEAGRKCGERKKKRRPNEIIKVQRLRGLLAHSRRSNNVSPLSSLLPSIPSC